MCVLITKNIITIQYWVNTSGGYDNRYIEIESSDENDALEMAKNSNETRRGKNFSVYKNPN